MTPTDTTRLLALIAGLDARTAPRDDREAKMRIAAWSELLRDVTYDDAKTVVTHYYSTDQQWPLQIGAIVAGCKPGPKWEGRDEHEALAGRAVPMPDAIREAIGRSGPDKRARERQCPWEACKAAPHSPCTVMGEAKSWMHPSRYGDEDEAVRKAKWAASQEDAA